MCCSPCLGVGCGCGCGCGGGEVTQWSRTQPAHTSVALGSSKIEVSEIMTIHNDQSNYVKHVLDNIYVFFTLFEDWVCGVGGGGGLYTTCEVFKTYCFDIVTTPNDQASYVKHVLGSQSSYVK